ncbi:MAG: hypothetical protein HY331_05565 [Chloroflexi bacterium]|nr:hypothetical protein [Chloroflexota bacterium]
MAEESLIGEVEQFLAGQRTKTDEDRLLDGGILLALLVMRGVAFKTERVEVRPTDRDGARLLHYLVEPGLTSGLARLEEAVGGDGQPVKVLHLDWERLASYFGKDLREFEVLLRDRIPRLIQRHRLTLAYLLSGD